MVSNLKVGLMICSSFAFLGCNDGDFEDNSVKAPNTYTFKDKDGNSTVRFTEQVTLLKMMEELKSYLGKRDKTKADLDDMFKNGTGFAEAALNSSGKKLRSTVAAGTYSNLTSADADKFRVLLDGFIKSHADLYSVWTQNAANGTPGKLTTPSSTGAKTVYIDAKGYEYSELFAKSLIGAVIVDQMLNRCIAQKTIDGKKDDHLAGTKYEAGANYTALQHAWDEAYGYVFGLETDPAAPINSMSERKGFLNSYLKIVDDDDDFKGIFNRVYRAFRLGRAAIDANNFILAGQAAGVIRKEISRVLGIMTAHYAMEGMGTKNAHKLHDLSAGYGFALALRFAETEGKQFDDTDAIKDILDPFEGAQGLWGVTDIELGTVAKNVAFLFNFSVSAAQSLTD